MMKIILKLIGCTVFAGFLFLSVSEAKLPVIRGIGGDFTLNSTLGNTVGLSDYRGKVVILTFGYTNCPDVVR